MLFIFLFSVWCLFPSYVFCVVFVSVLCFLCGVCFRPMFPVWCLFPSYVLCVQCSLCLWSVYSSLHLLLSLTFISVFCVVFVSVLCFLCGVCFRPMFSVWCLFSSYVSCVVFVSVLCFVCPMFSVSL
jgi:hypothetical protein